MLTPTLLALLGFLAMIGIIAVLMKNWTTPALAFLSVAVVVGAILLVTGTADLKTIGNFTKAGISSVQSTAILFIFSVLFFGIMTDAGMFDVIINALTKRVGNNVVGVCVIACLIAMIGRRRCVNLPYHCSCDVSCVQKTQNPR